MHTFKSRRIARGIYVSILTAIVGLMATGCNHAAAPTQTAEAPNASGSGNDATASGGGNAAPAAVGAAVPGLPNGANASTRASSVTINGTSITRATPAPFQPSGKADALMQESQDAQHSLKTDQKTTEEVRRMGNQEMTLDWDLKLDKTTGRLREAFHASGKNIQAPNSFVLVDDGKFAYTFSSAINAYYYKVPNAEDRDLRGMMANGTQPIHQHFNYLGASELDGHPVDVVEPVFPPMRKGRTAPTVRIYLDAKTHLRLRVTTSTVSNADGKGPVTMTSDRSEKHEVVDAPIPASAFTFTPAAGAREVPAPTPPPPGTGGPRPGQPPH